MTNFTTTLNIPAIHLPPDYLHHLNKQFPDARPLAHGDMVEDVTVEVEFTPGWHTPAKTSGPPGDCFPAEGEEPEIISVFLGAGFTSDNLVTSLPRNTIRRLVGEAMDIQQQAEMDVEDDDPRDYERHYD